MYPGQYYQNDYSNNAPNGQVPNVLNAGDHINNYYESSASSKHPHHHHQYYEQGYYENLGPTQHMPAPAAAPANTGTSGFIENCDTYGFQQSSYHGVNTNNEANHPHAIQNHPQMGYFGGFEGVPPNINIAVNTQGNNQQFDNSNSSSDFNFLSNIANDFSNAPEYYQLS